MPLPPLTRFGGVLPLLLIQSHTNTHKTLLDQVAFYDRVPSCVAVVAYSDGTMYRLRSKVADIRRSEVFGLTNRTSAMPSDGVFM